MSQIKINFVIIVVNAYIRNHIFAAFHNFEK